MSLQHITADAVANFSYLGRQLKNIVNRSDVVGLLGGGLNWRNGGCLTLANALRAWSGNLVSVQVAGTLGPDNLFKEAHAFGSYGDLCLDGDGVGSLDDMFEKLLVQENVACTTVVPGDGTWFGHDARLARRIADIFEDELGPFGDHLFVARISPVWREPEVVDAKVVSG